MNAEANAVRLLIASFPGTTVLRCTASTRDAVLSPSGALVSPWSGKREEVVEVGGGML